ncbi:MAG: hypothetical protein ACKO1T_01145 [Sediminibacterium sp.]
MEKNKKRGISKKTIIFFVDFIGTKEEQFKKIEFLASFLPVN